MMILITAKPRTGKSTLIQKLMNQIGIANCIGFYTEEIKENNLRIGFKLKLMDGREELLALAGMNSEIKIGRYGIDIKRFEETCIPMLKQALDGKKVIIIDEIGPMQVVSQDFRDMLLQLADKNCNAFGTIFYESFPWIDDFKLHKNVQLIELNIENRDNIVYDLINIIERAFL